MKLTIRYLLFIDPFTPFVWLCIIAMTVIIGPIMWVIHRYSYYYRYHDEINEFGLFNMSNCIWYCYGALLQQVPNVHDLLSNSMLQVAL